MTLLDINPAAYATPPASVPPPGRRRGGMQRIPLRQGLAGWRSTVPKFLAVGVTFTALYYVIYSGARPLLGPLGANLLALVLSTIADTGANRRLTFGVRDRSRRLLTQHQAHGLLVLLAGLVLTEGALWVQGVLAPDAGYLTELVVLGAANAAAGVVRYVVYAVHMHDDTSAAALQLVAGLRRGSLPQAQ